MSARLFSVGFLLALIGVPALRSADLPVAKATVSALAWLTESVFIGTGARFPDRVELAFYRVG